jgi:hypothetical protein
MDHRRNAEQEHQRRLRERFLDLANAFVRVRMAVLRRRGVQPPDDRDAPPTEKR